MRGQRTAAGPSRAEVTRLIEDAAVSLFASKGYARTTVDDIVADAGVSKPALYRHFESKKHLHMVLLERHREELAAAAMRARSLGNAGIDSELHAMLDAWFGYVEEHPYVWLLFRDTTGDPDVLALHVELQRRQRAADVALLRLYAPTIAESELDALGEAVRSSLYGLALFRLDRPDVTRAVVVAAMMQIVRGILAGAGN